MSRFFLIFHFDIILDRHKSFFRSNKANACCVSSTGFHRRCHCGNEIVDVDECYRICEDDPGCKGLVVLPDSPDVLETCQIATTSTCHSKCMKSTDEENVGLLNPDAECSDIAVGWGTGCDIKIHSEYMIWFN